MHMGIQKHFCVNNDTTQDYWKGYFVSDMIS